MPGYSDLDLLRDDLDTVFVHLCHFHLLVHTYTVQLSQYVYIIIIIIIIIITLVHIAWS